MKNVSFKIYLVLLLLFSTLIMSCSSSSLKTNSLPSNTLRLHFIDVGQGDAILVQYKDRNMLIDSSTGKEENKFSSYLKSLKINKFHVVIATHPDEDHIGNMSWVIKNYNIDKFYSPKVISTTKSFENMILALKDKNLKINVVRSNSTISFHPEISLEVFAPNSDKYQSQNDYSPIIKLSFGKNSVLFTGDAEKISEKETLAKEYNLKSDILKVGHHGSSSSTTEAFLKKVAPNIAVISCGKNNPYGHPTKEVLALLNKYNVKYYRTDLDGTIILDLNGETITK